MQETIGKMSKFKSLTGTKWDFLGLWLILNSSGTRLASQTFMLCHSYLLFTESCIFCRFLSFLCAVCISQSTNGVCFLSWFGVFTFIGESPSNVLLWDLSSVNTAAGLDLWHLRDFHLCRLWCLLDSVQLQRLLKLFKEPLVGGDHLESFSLGPKSNVAH